VEKGSDPTSLAHEGWDDAVEGAPSVVQRFATRTDAFLALIASIGNIISMGDTVSIASTAVQPI
jgi:hypothetical protein